MVRRGATCGRRFQRPCVPLSRVIESGAMSMRQNDCGAGFDRVNDRRANHRRVRDNNCALIPRLFGGEPFTHPPDEVHGEFAAMRCSRRIAQPGRNRLRLAGLHVVKCTARPASVVAIALARAPRPLATPKPPPSVAYAARELVQHRPAFGRSVGERSRSRRSPLVERLVRRKAHRAHGFGRPMRNEDQPSGHGGLAVRTSRAELG